MLFDWAIKIVWVSRFVGNIFNINYLLWTSWCINVDIWRMGWIGINIFIDFVLVRNIFKSLNDLIIFFFSFLTFQINLISNNSANTSISLRLFRVFNLISWTFLITLMITTILIINWEWFKGIIFDQFILILIKIFFIIKIYILLLSWLR